MQTAQLTQRRSTQYQYLKAPGEHTEYVVQKTFDYSIFKPLNGNRPVNPRHIKRLSDSFKNKYLLSPILVNEKMAIIDGQHRYAAAKSLGLPIYYIVIDGYGLPEVQVLNSNSSNWKKIDFLNAYCDMGYSDYIKFRQFMSDFPDFGFAVCEVIFTNKPSGNRGKKTIDDLRVHSKSFENGELKARDLTQVYKVARKVQDFKPYYSGYTRFVFVCTLITLFDHKNYNHEEMLHKLSLNSSSLVDCANINQYRALFEEIYNYRRREKVNLKY